MIKKGAFIGLIIGIIFSIFYSITSYWICLSVLSCPKTWEPYAIVFLIISLGGLLLGVFFVILVKLLYKWTKV
ncbi:MAG: hypothetical protein CL764_00610 [Chloroflexi bacterium]|nr:hypothetical protein [Chloroflexota bacterium]|tara:strand:+ start:2591 stop:2809 length:219 start_codon:yes stop_codon:yes gene_type:complete